MTLNTKKADVDELTKTARAEYKMRDERVEKMTDAASEETTAALAALPLVFKALGLRRRVGK